MAVPPTARTRCTDRSEPLRTGVGMPVYIPSRNQSEVHTVVTTPRQPDGPDDTDVRPLAQTSQTVSTIAIRIKDRTHERIRKPGRCFFLEGNQLNNGGVKISSPGKKSPTVDGSSCELAIGLSIELHQWGRRADHAYVDVFATGTILYNGNIGEIDYLEQKFRSIVQASKSRSAFFYPRSNNTSEIQSIMERIITDAGRNDITLHPVETIEEAREILCSMQYPPHPAQSRPASTVTPPIARVGKPILVGMTLGGFLLSGVAAMAIIRPDIDWTSTRIIDAARPVMDEGVEPSGCRRLTAETEALTPAQRGQLARDRVGRTALQASAACDAELAASETRWARLVSLLSADVVPTPSADRGFIEAAEALTDFDRADTVGRPLGTDIVGRAEAAEARLEEAHLSIAPLQQRFAAVGADDGQCVSLQHDLDQLSPYERDLFLDSGPVGSVVQRCTRLVASAEDAVEDLLEGMDASTGDPLPPGSRVAENARSLADVPSTILQSVAPPDLVRFIEDQARARQESDARLNALRATAESLRFLPDVDLYDEADRVLQAITPYDRDRLDITHMAAIDRLEQLRQLGAVVRNGLTQESLGMVAAAVVLDDRASQFEGRVRDALSAAGLHQMAGHGQESAAPLQIMVEATNVSESIVAGFPAATVGVRVSFAWVYADGRTSGPVLVATAEGRGAAASFERAVERNFEYGLLAAIDTLMAQIGAA